MLETAAILRGKSKNTQDFSKYGDKAWAAKIRNAVAVVTLASRGTIRILLILDLTMIAFFCGISVMSGMLLYTLNGQSTFVL